MTLHSTPLALMALLFPGALHAAPVFLENVSESVGWYDCNKKTKWTWGTKPHPTNPLNPPVSARPLEWLGLPSDENICWAAAASNVLQWWQDTKSDISSSTPNGKSATYEAMPQVAQLAIYQTISANWTNSGGCVEQAYNWWINGGMLSTTAYPSASTTEAPGGYWQELALTVPESSSGGAVDNPLFSAYSFWDQDTRNGVYQTLKNSINNNWGTTLTVGEEGRGHAITMWGYDTDEDGNLIIYLTDSDDETVGMFRQKVIVNDYKDEYGSSYCDIYLTSLDGENNVYNHNYEEVGLTGARLGEIQSFTAPLGDLKIPEPGAGLLFLCGSLLTLSCRRRVGR